MTNLYDQLISDKNIYKAIYSLESFVFEKELLDDKSLGLYKDLSDKYNTKFIESTIHKCRKKLIEIFEDDGRFFEIQVFFKPKKIDDSSESQEEVYRPMHSADLITQICIVAMLNLIMFNDSDGTRKLSDICKLIPSNFYGNIPSTEVHQIFRPWSKQYADYSTKIISANKEYNENKKYRREVNLDLKRFFPSVDPAFIYSFIWEKVSFLYSDKKDKECLKKILIKLLYFKINFPVKLGEDVDEYYIDLHESLKTIAAETRFNIGIPQGLPQAYLFGNFYMIEVAKIVAEKIKGDAYYYVDDSVIFTNVEKNDFGELVTEINQSLATRIKGNLSKNELPEQIKSLSNHFRNTYKVEIHGYSPPKSKTSISDISFQNYLWELAKPASTTAFQLKATFNELEDETLKRKLDHLIEYIDEKLSENANEDQEKLLKRYRKFYSYRLKILEYRRKSQVTKEEIGQFYYDYGIQEFDKYTFFKRLEDDVFVREAQMLLKYLINDEKKQREVIGKIIEFESSLDHKINNHYFSRVLTGYPKFLLQENIQYSTLEKEVKKSVPPYLRTNPKDTRDKIEEIINSGIFPGNLAQYELGFYEFIFNNAEEFKRKIYNALISYILSVPIDDGFNLVKIDGRAIFYYELRLLVYLRIGYRFDCNHLPNLFKKILKNIEDNEEKADLTLFEVLPIFKKYVNNPDQIDDLIITHRFINGIWKNGSKFLHFYTLHNEEHSVELIKYCTQITKSIDHLSIKSFDYYILFLACYLHDVAMVIHPKLDDFGKNDDINSDLEITKWKDVFQSKFIINGENKERKETILYPDLSNNVEIGKFILQSFHIINNFFENLIRKRHPFDGGKFIRNQHDLDFIHDLTRRIVAEVSESHGRDVRDVYGLKSKAKDDIVSEKYLMILLRLADLMDMAKDRVSINVLKQSIEQMPEESKFQWISHLAIDKCTIETDFKLIKNEDKGGNEILRIAEMVVFKIYLNTRILTSVENDRCEKLRCKIGPELGNIEIFIDSEQSSCSGCNFTSKWMLKKHSYLFEELSNLQKYLKRNSKNSVFDTSFKVILEMRNGTQLPAEFIDVVSEKIN